jgi:hypothetical protein
MDIKTSKGAYVDWAHNNQWQVLANVISLKAAHFIYTWANTDFATRIEHHAVKFPYSRDDNPWVSDGFALSLETISVMYHKWSLSLSPDTFQIRAPPAKLPWHNKKIHWVWGSDSGDHSGI